VNQPVAELPLCGWTAVWSAVQVDTVDEGRRADRKTLVNWRRLASTVDRRAGRANALSTAPPGGAPPPKGMHGPGGPQSLVEATWWPAIVVFSCCPTKSQVCPASAGPAKKDVPQRQHLRGSRR